jgi:hypothetical protein
VGMSSCTDCHEKINFRILQTTDGVLDGKVRRWAFSHSIHKFTSALTIAVKHKGLAQFA